MSNDQSLLFDPVASELPLLDLADTRLMEDIYKDNDSGWIKIGVVRDPVTRLLSAYLDVVYAWVSTRWSALDHDQRQRRRGLRVPDDWGWFDVIKRHGGLKEDGANQELPNTNDSRIPQNLGEGSEREGPSTSGDALPGMQGGAVPPVPTFEELLDLLAVDLWAAPSAFRPAASLCGMWKSPFDTIIPFESLQVGMERLDCRQTLQYIMYYNLPPRTFTLYGSIVDYTALRVIAFCGEVLLHFVTVPLQSLCDTYAVARSALCVGRASPLSHRTRGR